jgi:hypothetical protein
LKKLLEQLVYNDDVEAQPMDVEDPDARNNRMKHEFAIKLELRRRDQMMAKQVVGVL